MDCGNLFYDTKTDSNTLHNRLTLSKTIVSKGMAKKNELKDYLRSELKESFDHCEIKFYLQGSYRSRTLIAPLDRFSTYDIDMGIYIMSDDDEPPFEAQDVKEALKQTLEYYCSTDTEAKIQPSKNACEGLKFEHFLTIDTPIYYKSNKEESTPLLATDSKWIDSDPIAIQNWLTNVFDKDDDRAQLKRVVRYLKAWANISWKNSEHKKIPSLALNILVAQNLAVNQSDSKSFEDTVLKICSALEKDFSVKNPLNGDDIIGMSEEDKAFAQEQFSKLSAICMKASKCDELCKAIEYSNLFEHYFPQLPKIVPNDKSTNLPATTKVPEVYVEHYSSTGEYLSGGIADQVTVTKGDSLTFRLKNSTDFLIGDEVHWTVRNEGLQATNANDIGHRVITSLNDKAHRGTSYTGIHAMECLVKSWGNVVGYNLVKVNVRPVKVSKPRPFKGFTKFGRRR
ncbi:CBASS cGAMP synthase [Photobacterium leiognathi subsp. mandapamensis]|uniref:CBASS cGAMP synthase n=1 Tax=Photobacterium leiognathi TaxID=553611 RepID=UPI003AF3F060